MSDTALIIAAMDKRIAELKALIEERCPARKKPSRSSMKGKGKYGEFQKVRLTDSEIRHIRGVV